jgi:hypothetical protein
MQGSRYPQLVKGSIWTGVLMSRCCLHILSLPLQVTSHSGEHMDPELLNMERQLLAGAGGGDPEVGQGAGRYIRHAGPECRPFVWQLQGQLRVMSMVGRHDVAIGTVTTRVKQQMCDPSKQVALTTQSIVVLCSLVSPPSSGTSSWNTVTGGHSAKRLPCSSRCRS